MTNCHELPTEKISLSFLMKSYHTSFIKQKVFVHFFFQILQRFQVVSSQNYEL